MRTADDLRAAEKFLHQKIPLTRAMGVRVVMEKQHAFAIEAPVALNYNHLHTAFGGSINAVATLAGYAFLWLELSDRNAEVVVAESSIRFLAPVRQTIRAISRQPESDALTRFRSEFASNGKARLRLHVVVEEGGTIAADFHGTFVALRKKN